MSFTKIACIIYIILINLCVSYFFKMYPDSFKVPAHHVGLKAKGKIWGFAVWLINSTLALTKLVVNLCHHTNLWANLIQFVLYINRQNKYSIRPLWTLLLFRGFLFVYLLRFVKIWVSIDNIFKGLKKNINNDFHLFIDHIPFMIHILHPTYGGLLCVRQESHKTWIRLWNRLMKDWTHYILHSQGIYFNKSQFSVVVYELHPSRK